jgi:hypothetical protein
MHPAAPTSKSNRRWLVALRSRALTPTNLEVDSFADAAACVIAISGITTQGDPS